MKKEKAIQELKIERPRRAIVSEKEALKRMGFAQKVSVPGNFKLRKLINAEGVR